MFRRDKTTLIISAMLRIYWYRCNGVSIFGQENNFVEVGDAIWETISELLKQASCIPHMVPIGFHFLPKLLGYLREIFGKSKSSLRLQDVLLDCFMVIAKEVAHWCDVPHSGEGALMGGTVWMLVLDATGRRLTDNFNHHHGSFLE
ncbi:hypothetical protein CBL_02838 [Carabus blaptoides fortunei]